MVYTRKTYDEYDILVDYGTGYGYERVTTETTYKEAKARAREYQENEHMPVMIQKRRVKIKEGGNACIAKHR